MKIQNILIAATLTFLIVGTVSAATPARNDSTLHTQIEAAIKANDYNAWAKLMGNKGVAQKITTANWAKFVQIHTLEEQGKFEEAKTLRKELGLGLGAVSLLKAPAKSGCNCSNGQCKNGDCAKTCKGGCTNGQTCSGANCQGGCKGNCGSTANTTSTNPMPKKGCGCGKK